jgi:arsenite oxidase small subunit
MSDLLQKDNSAADHGKCMMTRRQFLMVSGTTAVAASTISITLHPGEAQAQARVLSYERQFITKLSALKENTPLDFKYPDEGLNAECFVVKMDGAKAGGGIGEQRDVVAFSYLCTHQGGPMNGKYQAVGEHRVLGQCPLHLSTYDLTRHGIIVSGQAYQSIPQVLLELDGDDVYAVGIMGLLYGRHSNLMEA